LGRSRLLLAVIVLRFGPAIVDVVIVVLLDALLHLPLLVISCGSRGDWRRNGMRFKVIIILSKLAGILVGLMVVLIQTVVLWTGLIVIVVLIEGVVCSRVVVILAVVYHRHGRFGQRVGLRVIIVELVVIVLAVILTGRIVILNRMIVVRSRITLGLVVVHGIIPDRRLLDRHFTLPAFAAGIGEFTDPDRLDGPVRLGADMIHGNAVVHDDVIMDVKMIDDRGVIENVLYMGAIKAERTRAAVAKMFGREKDEAIRVETEIEISGHTHPPVEKANSRGEDGERRQGSPAAIITG